MKALSPLNPKRNIRLQTYTKRLNNLFAYYPTQEVAGSSCKNYAPETRLTFNGTTTGATIRQLGIAGLAYDFDGTNDKVIAADLSVKMDGVVDFTLMFLANNADADALYGLCGFRPGAGVGEDARDSAYVVALNNGNTEFRFRDKNGVAVTVNVSTPSLDNWHSYFLIKSGTTITAYIDSATNNGSNGALSTFSSNNDIDFGIGIDGESTHFNDGLVQHVALLSRAISSDERIKWQQITGTI